MLIKDGGWWSVREPARSLRGRVRKCVCVCVCVKERERGDEDEGLGRGVVGDSSAHRLDDSTDKYNANRILHHVVRQSLELNSGETTVGTGG